jgi:hypothetical protein
VRRSDDEAETIQECKIDGYDRIPIYINPNHFDPDKDEFKQEEFTKK